MNPASDLKKLHGLYRELAGLAKAVAGLLEAPTQDQSGRALDDALDDALAKRRLVYKRLESKHGQMAPLWQNWDQAAAGLSAPELAKCQTLLDGIKEQARSIAQSDERAAELARQTRTELRSEMVKLTRGQKLLKAYGGAPAVRRPPKRISKSG